MINVRCIRSLLCLLLLSVFSHVSAEPSRAALPPSDDVDDKLRAIDNLSDAVDKSRALVEVLRALNERTSTSASHPTPQQLLLDATHLYECLKRLSALDSSIGQMGVAIRDYQRIIDAERGVAAAWIHAWGAFGNVTRATSAIRTGPAQLPDELQGRLYSLASNPGAESCLGLLLKDFADLVKRTDRFVVQVRFAQDDGKAVVQSLGVRAATLTARRTALESALHSSPAPERPGIAADLAAVKKELDGITTDSAATATQVALMSSWLTMTAKSLDPLRIRLFDETDLNDLMGPTWLQRLMPVSAGHRAYYVPSAIDVVGGSADDILADFRLMSLWALINYQCDTWRAVAGNHPTVGFGAVAAWLTDLRGNSDLDSLDSASRGQTLASAVKQRIDKMAKFLRFREGCGVEGAMDGLVKSLKDARANGRALSSCATTIGHTTLQVGDLVDAGAPLRGTDESLPQAELWLRYLVLLSFQGEGIGVIANSTAQNGVDKFWQTSGHGTPFVIEPGHKRISNAVVRWNQWPNRSHFMRLAGDITFATYDFAKWQADAKALDESQYRTIAFPATNSQRAADPDAVRRKKYADSLAASRTSIVQVIQQYVSPNIAGRKGSGGTRTFASASALKGFPEHGGRDAQVVFFQNWSRDWLSKWREDVADGSVVLNVRWDMSGWPSLGNATATETARLSSDVIAIGAQLNSAATLRGLTLAAYSTPSPAALAEALDVASGELGVTQWNLNRLPDRPFDEYARRVRVALNDLNQGIAAFRWQDALQARFDHGKEEVQILEVELAAAKLAVQVEAKGQEIAQLYKRIADKSKEIATLSQQIETARAAAASNQTKSAELRLKLASRAFDLAAGQLAALEQAYAQAQELAAQAEQQIRDMQPNLMDAAQKIDDQKKKAGFLSILKAVVTVVGAVLAPFTGGASLVAVGAANAAIDIYSNIDSMDFKNLPAALSHIGQIANDAVAFGDITFGKLGLAGEGGRKAWSDVKQFVKDRQDDVNRLDSQATQLLGGLAHQVDQATLSGVASALRANLPVELSDQGLRIDLSKARLRLNDGPLKDALSGLLSNGGMLISDERARALAAKLPFLRPDDANYRDELARAIDALVEVCPTPLLSQVAGSSRLLKDAKARLTDVVRTLDQEQREFVSHILAGWIVIKDADGNIVAVERSLSAETEKLARRLQAIQNTVLNDTIGQFADKVGQSQTRLNDLAQRASRESDADALRNIAQKEVPAEIEQVRADLDALNGKLELAREQLDRSKTELDITTFDKDAADNLEKAAQLGVQRANLNIERTQLKGQLALVDIVRADIAKERADLLQLAQDKRLDRAKAELQRIYATCLRYGFNPLTQSQRAMEATLANTLEVIDLTDEARVARRIAADTCAESLLGMIHWLRLLDVSPTSGQAAYSYCFERYRDVLSLVSERTTAQIAYNKLKVLADELSSLFEGRNPSDVGLFLSKGYYTITAPSAPRCLHWITKSEAENDIVGLAPADVRGQVIGYCTFAVNAPGVVNPVMTLPRPGCANYAVPTFASVSAMNWVPAFVAPGPPPGINIANLNFVLISPKEASPNPQLPVASRSAVFPAWQATSRPTWWALSNQVADSDTEVIIVNSLQQNLQLWKSFELTGIHGEWMLLIYDSSCTAANRRQLIDGWKMLQVKLMIPTLSIPGIAPIN
jgi:hypothetical protein